MKGVRLLVIGAVVFILLAGAGVWLWEGTSAPASARPLVIDADDIELVTQGVQVYADNCAACHGSDLEGEPRWQVRKDDGRLPAPPHDASGHTWHHTDDVLFKLTKYGPAAFVGGDYETDMPAYEDTLSDREIVAVLAYIKSTWPEQIRARHDQLNASRGQ